MEAAVGLLVDGGLPAVTVDAVVARSGVAKTTVYRHWGSRQELLRDAVAAALPPVVRPDTGSLAGDLRVLARGLARGLAHPRHAALLRAVLLPSVDDNLLRAGAAAADGRLGDGLSDLRSQLVAERHAAVRACVAQARLRGEQPPPDGVDGIIRSIAGPLLHRRFVEGIAPSAALADRCVERALLASPGRQPAPPAGAPRTTVHSKGFVDA